MTLRLGNVVYWSACAAALAWLAFAYAGISTMTPPDWSWFWIIGAVPSAFVWLAGKAIRYVLSGI